MLMLKWTVVQFYAGSSKARVRGEFDSQLEAEVCADEFADALENGALLQPVILPPQHYILPAIKTGCVGPCCDKCDQPPYL